MTAAKRDLHEQAEARLARAEASGRPEAYYRAGRLFLRAGDPDAAHDAFAAGLGRDPRARRVDRRLLAASPHEFAPRRAMARFVRRHLPQIQATAAERSRPPQRPQRRAFVYWAQGWDDVPAVVAACQAQIRSRHDSSEIEFVDDASLARWVEIPPEVRQKLAQRRAHLSDVIRLELLSRHGGVWLDATCYPTRNVLDALDDVDGSGLFAFTRRPGRPANWLIAASPGNYVIEALRAGHLAFWERYDEPFHYYIFHHVFEALHLLDNRFREVWDAVPALSIDPPHAFQRVMREPFEAERFDRLLAGSWVHKLTYKHQAEHLTEDTMLHALLSRHA